jgi:hypothetical protein
LALSYNSTGIRLACNGGSIASGGGDLTTAIMNVLRIGHNEVNANPQMAHYRYFAYYPKALSDTQLINLSAL